MIPKLHFVCASRTPEKAQTWLSKWAEATAGQGPVQFTVIENAPSMCAAYTSANKQIDGDAIVVYCHDDCLSIRHDFASRLRRHFADNSDVDVIGGCGADKLLGPRWLDVGIPHIFGMVLNVVPAGRGKRESSTTPGTLEEVDVPQHLALSIFGVHRRLQKGIKVADGFFLAARHKSVLRWDEATCPNFHFYDMDATLTAHQAGREVAIANDLGLLHYSTGGYGDPNWAKGIPLYMNKWKHLYPPQGIAFQGGSQGLVVPDLYYADQTMERLWRSCEN